MTVVLVMYEKDNDDGALIAYGVEAVCATMEKAEQVLELRRRFHKGEYPEGRTDTFYARYSGGRHRYYLGERRVQ